MNYIEIFWESGSMKYSELSLPFLDHQSEPLLVKKPKLTRSLLFNYSMENSTFYFELSEDKTLNEKIQEETILGTKIQWWKYEGSCLFTGFISEFPTAENRKIAFKADIYFKLNRQVNRVIKEDEFPNAGENLGKHSNIIVGNESAGMYEAHLVDAGKYLAAWNELSIITKAETKNGTDILSEITKDIDPLKGYTYILYNSTENAIYFNGKGPESQGALIENPATMLNYLLTNFSEFQIENLSEAEDIYLDRDYDNNFLFILDSCNHIDLFKSFSQSYNCRIIYTTEGKIRIKIIKWVGENPTLSIEECQIKSLTKRKETKYLRLAWHRKFQIDPKTKKYNMTPLDLEAEKEYKLQLGEFQQKFILDNMVSLDVGTRDAYMMGRPIHIYSLNIPECLFLQIELGDTIEFRHRDSYYPNQYRLMQILRTGAIENSGLYPIEGYDINEIQGTPFIVREAGHPQNPVIYEAGDSRNSTVWWSN